MQVYSPRSESRAGFVADLADLPVTITAAESAVEAASLVICAAQSRDDPARKIKSGLAPALHGGAFINRQAWKFQGWLQGYNGGPLRQPTQRIHDQQMTALRKGLVDAGLEPSMDPFREFFIGRNPG